MAEHHRALPFVLFLGLLVRHKSAGFAFLLVFGFVAVLPMLPSGYTGTAPRGGEPGSNGLTLDEKGRLVLCQHGDIELPVVQMTFDDC